MSMIRMALPLAVVMLLIHVNVEPTSACSCIELTPAEAFERADAVFVGEVTAFKVRSGLFGKSSIDPTTVEFAVSEVWKGPRQEFMTIRTVRSEVSCGFEFDEGLKYLVYARDGQTGLCDRTALTIRASGDLAALGEGWQPGGESDGPSDDVTQSNYVEPPRSGGACAAAATDGRQPADLAALGLLAGAAILGAWPKRRL